MSVGRPVHNALENFDAAEVHAAEVAQAFVVVPGDEDDPRPMSHFAKKFLHDVVMGLRPMRSATYLPEIDDVADKIDNVGVVVL